MITASAIVYADLIFLRIQTHGFFSDDWKMTSVTEEVNQIISYIVRSRRVDLDRCPTGVRQFEQLATRQERPGVRAANSARDRHRGRRRRPQHARRSEVVDPLFNKRPC